MPKSRFSKHPARAIVDLDPSELEVVILQDRQWLAVWCGPRKRKIGHWFVYSKAKADEKHPNILLLRATIPQVPRDAKLDELAGFALPMKKVWR